MQYLLLCYKKSCPLLISDICWLENWNVTNTVTLSDNVVVNMFYLYVAGAWLDFSSAFWFSESSLDNLYDPMCEDWPGDHEQDCPGGKVWERPPVPRCVMAAGLSPQGVNSFQTVHPGMEMLQVPLHSVYGEVNHLVVHLVHGHTGHTGAGLRHHRLWAWVWRYNQDLIWLFLVALCPYFRLSLVVL